jgi:hypothetical protein
MMEELPAYQSKAYIPHDTFADSYGYVPKARRPVTALSSLEAQSPTPTTEASFIEMHR